MQEQKQLTFINQNKEQAAQAGYATFNNCNHYVVDMSHLRSSTEDYMNTISIKLPNGNAVTLCVMQTGKEETCIDTVFHGDNIKTHRVSGFGGEGKDQHVYNKDIYALIATAKEVK